jgi:transcriptional activator of glycolytic enzymes GCR1
MLLWRIFPLLWRLINLPSGSQQSPELSCQPSYVLPLHLPRYYPMAIEILAEQPPTYHMSRGITTVSNQWLEWTVGVGGQLSVEALDERV